MKTSVLSMISVAKNTPHTANASREISHNLNSNTSQAMVLDLLTHAAPLSVTFRRTI
ncbi:hypothetical protein FHS27_006445 [Rhodopirellula rubra]|uniref:Uncharacterized protein n=1 Tax=Aporhodopirellula rubra TaxID=980271 RepID=A0A7W5E6B5_9BACT|nr:hypothetical protein [Aporhodopirellula rubra]